MSKNELKMPMAEWLFRMSEANVPYQARGLAIYAVLFRVTANDELAKLAGMDMKGVADKTYNKWKKMLSDHGWVIIKSVTSGRSTTVEIFPAHNARPVSFTDVSARDPGKLGKNKSCNSTVKVTGENYEPEVKNTSENYERDVEVTSKNYGPTVEITDEPVKVTSEKVEITVEKKTSPAPARVEDNIIIYNNINNLPNTYLPPHTEQDPARERGLSGVKPGFAEAEIIDAADILGPNEADMGHGVVANCETVRHTNFRISLKAIEMQLVGVVPMAEIKSVAIGHALQWAVDIESGKKPRDVVPNNTASFIRASIQHKRNADAVTEVRKQRAGNGPGSSRAGESSVDKLARLGARIEAKANAKRNQGGFL